MLLGPQRKKSFRNPAVDGTEPMQPCVTRSAQSDQSRRNIARAAVVDHERFTPPAGSAPMMVTDQDFLAPAAESGAGTLATPVAGPAPASAKQFPVATGTAQRNLRVESHGTVSVLVGLLSEQRIEQIGNGKLDADNAGPLNPQGPEDFSLEVGDVGLGSDRIGEGLGQGINHGVDLGFGESSNLEVADSLASVESDGRHDVLHLPWV